MGDSAYNVLGLPDLELVSQHYETRKHQDGYSYDIIVYAVKHVGYVPYCHACQEATGETCIAQKHEKGIRYIKDLDLKTKKWTIFPTFQIHPKVYLEP